MPDAIYAPKDDIQVAEDSFKVLEQWMGDEWRKGLTPYQNVQSLVEEVKHFRKLMNMLQDFVIDLDEWLNDYEGGDFVGSQETTNSTASA